MSTRRKKAFPIVICVLFLFVTFASLFYIAKETNHYCIGEDCPICVNIHQAEQVLCVTVHQAKTILGSSSSGTTVIATGKTEPILPVLLITGQFLFVVAPSLVSQKVRLND